jgi:hypothetical protein
MIYFNVTALAAIAIVYIVRLFMNRKQKQAKRKYPSADGIKLYIKAKS